MRGTKAKRLRNAAREVMKDVKPVTGERVNRHGAPAGWGWLTGFRREYQDSKRRAA